jgi:predicted membrane protein
MTKPAKKTAPQIEVINVSSLKFWVTSIKELGIPSFIVLFFVIIFVTFASKDQKSQFIDEFFLFKDVSKNPFPVAFVVLILIAAIILQYVYYNKIINQKSKENERLGAEKSKLQEVLLNKQLHSSQ